MDIFVKLLTILMETSDQPNLPAEHISSTAERLFRWVAHEGELHVRDKASLRAVITDIAENRACEHGARYIVLVELDAFWDEKRFRTLKDARRATRHHHVAVEGIAPLLDWVKTGAKKEIQEWRE